MSEPVNDEIDKEKLRNKVTNIMIGKGIFYYELLDGARYTVDGKEAIQLGVVDEMIDLITSQTKKAVIKELKTMWNATQPDIIPSDAWQSPEADYIQKRLIELEGK